MENKSSEGYIKDDIISSLSSQGPLNNKTFTYLLSELSSYLKTPEKSQSLYKNLYRLLTEVLYTSNKPIQSQLLLKILEWYKLKTQSSPVPSPSIFNESLKITFPNTSSEPKKVPQLKRSYKKRTGKPKVQVLQQSTSITNDSSMTPTRSIIVNAKKNGQNYRRMSQSPGIIRSIVNSFVKNSRSKMYNFSMQEFLSDPSKKMLNHEDLKRQSDRPMSCAMKRQLKEVDEVKYKLACRGVHVKIKSLYDGIVLDDNLQVRRCSLPRGGELLMRKIGF